MNFYRNSPAVAAMSENGAVRPVPPSPPAMTNGPLLAVPYVLPQMWAQTYDPAVALKRGTIFPALDLPFLGMGGAR